MTAICPHCGYDLERDEALTLDGYHYDRQIGVSYGGQALNLKPASHHFVGSLMRANGRALEWGALADRLGSEAVDQAGAMQHHLHHAKRAMRAVGGPVCLKVVWGFGVRWVSPADETSAAATADPSA